MSPNDPRPPAAGYQQYLDGLERVTKQGRYNPLGRLVLARLRQSPEVVEGLVSPPLGRFEPDPAVALYQLYARLADDEPARDDLRRVVIDLYLNTLGDPHADLAEAGALARLIGFFQTAQRPALARPLQLGLWGLLRDHLPKPLEQLISLEGRELRRAGQALDLWLALAPPLGEGLPQGVKDQVCRMFEAHLAEFGQQTLTEDRFLFLLFSFRALLKVCPEPAGRWGLQGMCKAVKDSRRASPLYERRFRGLCTEVGQSLARPHADAWREALRRGLQNGSAVAETPEHALYWDALERLGQAEYVRACLGDKAQRLETLKQQRPLLRAV